MERPRGEDHPGAVSTANDIRAMHRMRREGRTMKQIGDAFGGIAPAGIWYRLRTNWQWLAREEEARFGPTP